MLAWKPNRRQLPIRFLPAAIRGPRTAIAWTTSASVVGVIEMVRGGHLPQQGFLKQESIPLEPYLKTRTGNYYNIGHRSRHA